MPSKDHIKATYMVKGRWCLRRLCTGFSVVHGSSKAYIGMHLGLGTVCSETFFTALMGRHVWRCFGVFERYLRGMLELFGRAF